MTKNVLCRIYFWREKAIFHSNDDLKKVKNCYAFYFDFLNYFINIFKYANVFFIRKYIKYNCNIELSVFYFFKNVLYSLQSSTGPNCLNGNKAFDFFYLLYIMFEFSIGRYTFECKNISDGILLHYLFTMVWLQSIRLKNVIFPAHSTFISQHQYREIYLKQYAK